MNALKPGDTIGILGGGQLGRMLALKAAKLGLKAHIYVPDFEPACEVSAQYISAGYEDETQLQAFAADVDLITYEFENVPALTAAFLNARKPVFPPPCALEIAQDRLKEKEFIRSLGLPLAPFRVANSAEDLQKALAELNAPCVLKTQRLGYDGKGQATIKKPKEAAAAFEAVGRAPSVLEKFVALEKEISMIAVRGRNGENAIYDVAENVHRDHILHTSTVPARISEAIESEARAAALKIIEALAYVGVLAVEFFIDGEGRLLVNEIAPRVHNSGHWTLDACQTCQFENHIRAISGWPLGTVARTHDVVMTNLIGAEVNSWQTAMSDKANSLWLYGKKETKPGRKMGHVNRLAPLA